MDSQSSYDGGIVVDKPPGLTSQDVVRQLKRRFEISKIGHAGTLDPLATGVLVVLLGRATRLQSLFLESNKSYDGIIKLGLETSTDDIEGNVVSVDGSFSLPESEAFSAIKEQLEDHFVGKQEQVPPQISALKVNGVRAYKRARRGEEVSLSARSIEVLKAEFGRISSTQLSYAISCSKGTYVRALARDIGKFLRTFGCVETLRRTASGRFTLAEAVSLDQVLQSEELFKARLISSEELVRDLPKLLLSGSACRALRHGDQRGLNTNRLLADDAANAPVDLSVISINSVDLAIDQGTRVIFNRETGRLEGVAKYREDTELFELRAMI